ncbi:MAG TPA: MlaD family protein [Thermodesulfobacteriota bacterium]|nr:MlaD family protein [Thermodesulfobacteriota bacterium]
MASQRGLNLKVGLFVLITLVSLMVIVFFMSGQSGFFKENYTVETSFNNVAGLAEGASVRLSGMRIGSVERIHFPEQADEDFIVVRMEVNEEGIERIGPDSVAAIRTEGLLGDKYIEIRGGATRLPKEQIPDVLRINSYTPPELDKLLGQSEELVDNVISISESLDKIVKAFGREENIENISRTLASIRRTVEAIETEQGVLHTMIYGRKTEKGFDKNTLDRLDETINQLNALLKEIRTGEGVLNALLYDQQLRKNFSDSISNINSATQELSGEDGVIIELKETMINLREISERLEGGEGTLGALINDPTVYDQLKGVLGEAERSRFVRSAVKYLIEEGKKEDSDQKK